jgi:hypothetical protein
MKCSLVLFVAIVLAQPHGPDEPAMAAVPAPSPAPAKAAPVPATATKIKTPAGCNALSSDIDFPPEAVFKKAFPSVIARSKTLAAGVGAPDYKIRAKTYKDVQDAVKFAAKHNLRLSVITSGHDFLGRNDAPSGLVVDVSLLTAIRLHENWAPSAKGSKAPTSKVNTIKGSPKAVTIGVGVLTQPLNNVLSPFNSVTVGAAHGSVAPAGGYVS